MILCGIVLYNPDILRLKENIEAILPQVDALVLVDNGSENLVQIRREISEYDHCTVIENGKNQGIAFALNQIRKAAVEQKFDWYLTLDQDSVAPTDLIEKFSYYMKAKNVGILCPQIQDRSTGIKKPDRQQVTEVEFCITSASLVNTNLCGKILYDDEMFIDLVDVDFCIQVRKMGIRILRVNDAVLLHQVGNARAVRFCGVKFKVFNHSAFRKYYFSRNCIYLYRKYNDMGKRLHFLKKLLEISVKVLFEKEKKQKYRAIYKGICDGTKMKIQEQESEACFKEGKL